MSNLLIVDDEESICWGLAKVVEGLGHTPITKSSAEAALRLSADTDPSAIVLDVRLPGMSGLDAIPQFREQFGDVPIIVITAHGDLETAVDAVRNGAFEYVVKPFETEQIRQLISRAIAMNHVSEMCVDDTPVTRIDGMNGKSRVMQDVYSRIALAASSEAGVLIQGESGTGKELAARAVHRYSGRASGPFVPVNVAALSSSVAESEMFGHVRGAFTGADSDRVGLLKRADGGTLFLDEVGDIPVEMQVKLLRALEHGVFLPVGSNEPLESDFRVVSATNSDLALGIQTGSFRRDLFYRLSAFQINMPPLRKRDDDAALLAKQFVATIAGIGRVLTEAAEKEILARSWYGNVRELRNAIEHAVVVSRGASIEPQHLPEPLMLPFVADDESTSKKGDLVGAIRRWVEERLAAGETASQVNAELLSMVEQPLIQGVLKRHQGNFSAAAKDLGVHRTTLRKKESELSQLNDDAADES